jgi:hypothetical protein
MPIRLTTPQSCSRVCIATNEGHGTICIARGPGTPQGDATRLGAYSCGHWTAPPSAGSIGSGRRVGTEGGRHEGVSDGS